MCLSTLPHPLRWSPMSTRPAAAPDTAPDFALSRPTGSVRTQGAVTTFSDTGSAVTSLERGDVKIVVGALPFDREAPAALTVPEHIIREDGCLQPHAYYRSGPGSVVHARVSGFDPEPREHLRRIEAAIDTIRESRLDKVVLARAVDFAFDPPVDPRLVAARLIDLSQSRDGFMADLSPAGLQGHTIVGSSPELLIRRDGLNIYSYPLAGSAPRIPNDPVADAAAGKALAMSKKNLAEHSYVVEHIREVLEPLCTEMNISTRPQLESTNEMWHLATPIKGVLKQPAPTALELAAKLYPTPAVCGTPQHAAETLITTAESDRSFYAGAVGWTTSDGNGEYVVSIRCAQVNADGTAARAWAGGGLVASSDAEEELAETTAKLLTIQRALGL